MIADGDKINGTSNYEINMCIFADFGAQHPQEKANDRCALHPFEMDQWQQALNQPVAEKIYAPEWINTGFGARHNQQFQKRHGDIFSNRHHHESEEDLIDVAGCRGIIRTEGGIRDKNSKPRSSLQRQKNWQSHSLCHTAPEAERKGSAKRGG